MYLSIPIKNRSPKPLYVENIGFTNLNGHDHLMFPSELPAELGGFRTIKFPFWEGWKVADGATSVFAVDGRRKKHRADQKVVKRAIDLAARAKKICEEQQITTHEYLQNMSGILQE